VAEKKTQPIEHALGPQNIHTRRVSTRLLATFLLIFAVCLGIMFGVLYLTLGLVSTKSRSDIQNLERPYANSLLKVVLRRIDDVNSLVAFVKTHKNTQELPDEFAIFSGNISDPSLRLVSFMVTEGTVNRYVYPLSGNEALLGLDWLKYNDPKAVAYFKQAMTAKETMLFGPLEAHPGTKSISAARAVYNADGSLFGVASGVYLLSPIVSGAGLPEASKNMNIALRAADKTMIYGDAAVFRADPDVEKIRFGQTYWEMAAIPKEGWSVYNRTVLLPMLIAGIVVSFLIAALLSIGLEVNKYLGRAVSEKTKDLIAGNLELTRVNRLYGTLGKINEEIVRASDTNLLLRRICETIVAQGGFRMCWIGIIDKESKRVIPAATAGVVSGYFENMKIIAPDKKEGHGPKAKALLDRKSFISNDVEKDPGMAPWRDLSRQHGYRSEATLPLSIGQELIGSLNVYSSEIGVFQDEEVRLLTEISGDISYAIDALDKVNQKKKAEKEVEHAASFPKNNPHPVCEFDRSGKVTYANDAAGNALTAIGAEADINKFKPADFKKIAKMMDTENPPLTVSREVTIKDHVFGETVHLATAFGTIRIYARDVTEEQENEAILAQQRNELERSYSIIKNSLDGTVQAIAAVAEHKDPYTAGHERRVVELSVAIGQEMGLKDSVIEGLKIAATLHDVGKIYIPAEILSKPGKLNSLEFSMIKAHPRYSYEVLSNIEFPWPIADIALQHHERIDGSGYPAGLKEKDILLEAKILAVADVVEAMASHRPYRPSLPIEEALAEIKKGRGKIFDAKVVDAALKIFKNGYKF
jgi:HD-GYP domain-containing protein (c-di-GMP phosphodiesterase class II)/sensor domain CHASE-containing protein/putative methionine-R-sulfoxide reductase with GAF domain